MLQMITYSASVGQIICEGFPAMHFANDMVDCKCQTCKFAIDPTILTTMVCPIFNKTS